MNQPIPNSPVIANVFYEGGKPSVLNDIWAPECGAAIYRRQPNNSLQAWLKALPKEKLPTARLSLNVSDIKSALMSLCAHHGIADEPNSMILIEDIDALARQFASVMKTEKLNLRLDVVTNNACPRFHRDNVLSRLLCTYLGQGTEYGICTSHPEPNVIHQLPTGTAAIFKGRQWSSNCPLAVYHRSPQIAGTGETRLLLVLDVSEECVDDCCL